MSNEWTKNKGSFGGKLIGAGDGFRISHTEDKRRPRRVCATPDCANRRSALTSKVFGCSLSHNGAITLEDAMRPRPVLLLYGNCQIATIADILRDLPLISKSYDVLAFNKRDLARGIEYSALDDALESSEFLIYQTKPMETPPAFAQNFISRGSGIRVPLTTCGLFWPSDIECSYDPRYPELPNGRYPLGDNIIARLLREYPDDEALVNRYLEMDFADLFPLQDMVAQWHRFLEKLENETAIKVRDFILENWRTKRLYWISRHPTNILIGEIVRQLVKLLGKPASESQLKLALDAHEQDFLMKPIHPSLVQGLNLTWISDGDLYKHLDDPPVTRTEWYLRYAAHTRELMRVSPEPFQEMAMPAKFWNRIQRMPA